MGVKAWGIPMPTQRDHKSHISRKRIELAPYFGCMLDDRCGNGDVDHYMNSFQLGIILSPIAGCLGGLKAAAGHGFALSATCVGIGIVTSIGVYFAVVFGCGSLFYRAVFDDKRGEAKTGALAWLAQWAIMSLVIAVPFLAWFIAYFTSELLVTIAG
jgi:hypothetical protein